MSRSPSRRLISAVVAAPALLGLARRAKAQAGVDLAIIGAGAAGIAAARQAQAHGLTFQIFEARPRIGGRVYTDMSLGPAFDAGAAYIHFRSFNPWGEIARKLDMPVQPFLRRYFPLEVFRRGQPVPQESRVLRREQFRRFNETLEEVVGADITFADAAQRYSPDLLEVAESLSLLSLGEDAERVSVQDYQRLEAEDDEILPLGYGTLLNRYAQGLDVALETPVTAVDYSGAGVRVETPRGAVVARAAIITLPISLLQAERVHFSPPLPRETLHALDGLFMGALTKVALNFTGTRFGLTPFTQFIDNGQETRDLIQFEFWPFDRDVVLAMFGGDYARNVTAMGEADAVRHVLARLEALLGERVIQTFRAGRLAGWSADPLALGSYSIARPGHAVARDALAKPVADRLYYANAWGATLVDAGESGHINITSGHGPWPEGLLLLARLMKQL